MVPESALASPADMPPVLQDVVPRWGLARRLGFRFVAAYFALTIAPFPLDVPPKTEFVDDAWSRLWDAIVPWVATHLFRISGPLVKPNGSGDTSYAWVQQACFAVIAVLIAAGWEAFARDRFDDRVAYRWLRTAGRFWVSWYMLAYGMDKLLHQQMPWRPERLIEPYGEFSPMGVMWSTLGYSGAYSAFAGGAEYLGGVLLMFERTASLGALVAAGVMTNVVMMNFCFDIPVKLFSTQLLLMSIFTAGPDLGRVLRALLSRGAISEKPGVRLLPDGRWRTVARVSLGIWIAYAAYEHLYRPVELRPFIVYAQAHSPADGLWQVDRFATTPTSTVVPASTGISPSEQVEPRLTHAVWARLAITSYAVFILFADGSYDRFPLAPEANRTRLVFRSQSPTSLEISQPDPRHMVLEGDLAGQHLRASVRKMEEREFPLVATGFHFVQEHPNNR